jgi:hypothetical protein
VKEEFEYKIITKNSEEKYFTDLLENAAFIHKRQQDTIDWLKWKYFDSPFGECICLVALTKDDKIAGEVTFGQYQYILNGSIVNCLISYQTMIYPKHQKKGLFNTLTKEILKIAQSKGIELVMNFPNKASYVPFEKLNFIPINHIENRVFFVKKPSTLFNIFSIKEKFNATIIKKIPENQLNLLNELKNSIKPLKIKDTLVPNRTPEFILWRYFTYPIYDYRIIKVKNGWSIVRLGNRKKFSEVQIMEIFTEFITSKFLFEIRKEIVKQLKPNIIIFNLSSNHPSINGIQKLGFLSLPHNINFFTYAINKKLNHLLNKNHFVITATEFHRY